MVLVEILPRRSNGEEPPPPIAELMTTMDVVLCPTSKSLTHTDARRRASAAGVRVGTLPGVTEDIMVRCMNADYTRIAERTHRLCALMEATQVIRVQAPSGTDVTLPVAGRRALASSGLFPRRGIGQPADGGSVPRPTGGSVERCGRRRWIDGRAMPSQPIRILVKHGYATEITGGPAARRGGAPGAARP